VDFLCFEFSSYVQLENVNKSLEVVMCGVVSQVAGYDARGQNEGIADARCCTTQVYELHSAAEGSGTVSARRRDQTKGAQTSVDDNNYFLI